MNIFDPRLPYAIVHKSGVPPREDFWITEVSGKVLVQSFDRKELVMVGANFGNVIAFIRLRNDKLPRFTTATVIDASDGFIVEIKGGGGCDIEVDESKEKKVRIAQPADDDWTGTRTG